MNETPLAVVARPSGALQIAADDVDEAAFRDFIRLHVARQDAATATVENYVREARFFRRWLDERGLALRALTNHDVREWVAELVAAGRTPATIATKLAGVRRLLDAAVARGVLERNPAQGVSGPRDKRVQGAAAQRTLSVDEVRGLLQSIPDAAVTAARDHAIAGLLIGHGLRTVEVERMNIGEVNLAERQVIVHGKTADRVVFLRADVALRLQTLIEARIAAGAAPGDAVFVSLSRNDAGGRGERLSRRGIRFIVDRLYAAAGLIPRDVTSTGRKMRRAQPGAKRAARAAGLRVPTTHGLRATNITIAIDQGADVEHVAADVGHGDIRTTMRYVELQRRRERNSALRLPVEF